MPLVLDKLLLKRLPKGSLLALRFPFFCPCLHLVITSMTERPSGRPNCSSMYISSDTFSNSQGIETASYLLLMIELVFQHSSKRDRKFDLLSHLLLGQLPLSEVHLQSLAHRLHVQPLARMASFCSRAHSHEHHLWKYSLLVFYSKELIQI